MSQPKGMDDPKRTPGQSSKTRNQNNEPGWADGLRQLYNSVLHEPLPDSFEDLLQKLDRAKNERK